MGGPGLLLLEGHVGHEAYLPIAVAIFVVIPRNELNKVVIWGNARPTSKVEEWLSLLK